MKVNFGESVATAVNHVFYLLNNNFNRYLITGALLYRCQLNLDIAVKCTDLASLYNRCWKYSNRFIHQCITAHL